MKGHQYTDRTVPQGIVRLHALMHQVIIRRHSLVKHRQLIHAHDGKPLRPTPVSENLSLEFSNTMFYHQNVVHFKDLRIQIGMQQDRHEDKEKQIHSKAL